MVYHRHSYRGEGWRSFQFKNFYVAKWHQLRLSAPHITKINAAKSMPILTSQLCGDLLPAACLSMQDRATYRLPEHSQMSDRLKKEALVKTDCCTFGYDIHMSC